MGHSLAHNENQSGGRRGMIHIGIDAGVNGGVAILDNGQMEAHGCPDTVKDMSDLIKDAKWDCLNMFCIIEKVHSMPKQGVRSVWTFGKNYGQWLGILAAHEIPYREITPQTWMKFYGAMPKDRKKRKNHLKHLAQGICPHLKVTLKTADAILLANWCREIAPDLSESELATGFVHKSFKEENNNE